MTSELGAAPGSSNAGPASQSTDPPSPQNHNPAEKGLEQSQPPPISHRRGALHCYSLMRRRGSEGSQLRRAESRGARRSPVLRQTRPEGRARVSYVSVALQQLVGS